MKGYFILILIGLAIAWEYHRRLRIRNSSNLLGPGTTKSTGSGVRQATQFSSTGSTTPGSGVLPVQPTLTSTWGISGLYGPGHTGVSVRKANGPTPA